MRWLGVLLLWASLLSVASPARAEGPARSTVALIVGSNRGALVARPDLHFADDDAARYYETFRMLASPDDVALITRFDRDSERQHAPLRELAKPPSRSSVQASAAVLARRVHEARASGGEVDFYFVYAGHGDVDHGEGFLELEDGRFTARDLESILRTISATRAHVILDSCNSVFMISARKPGGQHFETGSAAAKQLAERMPEVGVFLSTSAEGEVFEWSELGAGIFSHVVRSGISGAADANGDGAVSYAEMRAFVDVATRSVPNPRFRPQVFARGPSGKDEVSLFSPGVARGKKLHVAPRDPRRLTLRDADDVPWVDVHCEAEARCTLTVPERAAAGATVETYRIDGGEARSLGRVAFVSLDDRPVALAGLSPVPDGGTARGPREMFRALFAEPFGPRAYARYLESPPPPEPVYGVTSSDVERHRLLLGQISNSQRGHRLAEAAGLVAGGVLGTGSGVVVLAREGAGDPWTPAKVFGAIQTSVGVSMLIASPFVLLIPDRSERLHEEFEADLSAHPEDRAGVLARGEQRLFAAAESARSDRILGFAISGGLALVQLSVFIGNELQHDPSDAVRYGVGGSLLLLGSTAFIQLVPSELERMAELWRSDPNRAPRSAFAPRFGLSPTLGGGMATFGARF